MKKYYLAAEGGGTKLLVVLYDEALRILRMEKTAGTNDLFRPVEEIEREMDDLVLKILSDDVREIEQIDLALVGSAERFVNAVRRHVPVHKVSGRGEGHVALAVTGEPYGIVAQAGTGSDAFFLQKSREYAVGGWGPLLGDEGSGYDIGMMAIRAAIYADDGRGPKTMLSALVKEHFGVTKLWDLIGHFNRNPETRLEIAGVTRIISVAAAKRDPVALDIYARAAHQLSNQVLTVIHKAGGVWDGPIVTSGGAWKGSEQMFDVFASDIHSEYPEAEIVFPAYEPIVGCIVLRLLEEGKTPAEIRSVMQSNFEKLHIHYDDGWTHPPYFGYDTQSE